MLALTLNTNEVKNSSGTEVEYQSLGIEPRGHKFAKIGESPALPNRLSINHTEVGSGIKARRRSVVRVDVASTSTIDPTVVVTASAYIVLDSPVGALTSNVVPTEALAALMSFVATQGGTTVLYDGSGNGAQCLLNGAI
jgi:hypothetical protein